MLTKLNRSAQQTSLESVVETLRERIHSGLYPEGERLPAERFLTDELDVDRRVVRAAIARLTEEGMVSHRRNCRPIVRVSLKRTRDNENTIIREPQSLFRFVALVMWHGGIYERAGTAQERIFWGMNQTLGQAGYHGTFLDLGETIGSPQENAEREAAHLQYILDHGFGGVVLYTYAYQSNRKLIQEVARHIPLVLIDRTPIGVQADFVGVDNQQGMADATAHLIERGHRRIAYVTHSENINTVQDRLQGYLRTIYEVNHPGIDEIVIVTSSAFRKHWQVFDLVFSQPLGKRPTAVLCFNDYEAVRVAERLAMIGLSVPDDVALVSFDDIIHQLPGEIGLSTVAQPFEEIGRTAARQFLRRIQNPTAPHSYIELPTQLVIRDSSATPLSKDPVHS